MTFSPRLLMIVLTASAGLFFGTANPAVHLPLAILLYPMALFAASSSRSPFLAGWLAGLPGAAAALYWIAVAAWHYGGFPWVLAIPCSVLLGMYVSVWGGLFAWVLSFMGGFGPLRRTAAAGLLWCLMEWTRGWFCTGFSWLTLSSGLAAWPVLLQPLSALGEYGYSGLLAFTAGLLWEGLAKLCAVRRRIMPGLAYLTAGTAVCLASLSFGLLRMHAAPQDFSSGVPVVMGLVQGNILQDVKWTPEFQKASFEKYMRLSMDCVRSAVSEGLSMPAPEALAGSMGKDSGDPLRDAVISPFVPDLLLWPETAMPFYYPSGEHVDHIRNFVRHMDMPLITGIPAVRRIPGERPLLLNRACLFSAGGGESSYDKEHLVPFGEYIPPFLNWEVFRPLLQGLGGFARGEKAALFSLDLTGRGRVSLGMLICYEAIFPELAWQRVKDGAQVLLNISNDAWYDRTSAAEQHLQLAVMRAVEQGRWIARSTNTGVTAFIDPLGGVHAMAAANGGHALFTEGWLTGMVLALDGHTLYFHLHPWMPWVALTLFCLLLFSARRIPSLHARKNSIE